MSGYTSSKIWHSSCIFFVTATSSPTSEQTSARSRCWQLPAQALGVIAFEPGEEAFCWLKQNIALNDLSSLVDAREQALGGRSGSVPFTSNMDTVNHVVSEKQRNYCPKLDPFP